MQDTEGVEGMGIPAPVGSVYCLPHETQLTVKQKLLSFSRGQFRIEDGEGSLLYDVKCKDPFNWRENRVVQDQSGQPLLLLKSMWPNLHQKWAAYRGDDEIDAKLLFTIQKSGLFQFTSSFDIFLPTNNDHSRPDFTVEGNFLNTVYTVLYNGTPIAKAKKICFSREHVLTIYPGADRAFISALVVVLYSEYGQD